MKRREVSWTLTKKLAQKRSREQGGGAGLERERAGLLLLQLFPNSGATDIVFVTLFCIQLGQRLRGAVVAAQCRTDTALTFSCSGSGPRQPWSFGLAPVSRFHSSVHL